MNDTEVANRVEVDDLYPLYRSLVAGVCRRFTEKLPDEDLEDLTQTAWESIVRKFGNYDEATASITTWLTIVSRSAMWDMVKAANAIKRGIALNCVSLDSLTNGKDK